MTWPTPATRDAVRRFFEDDDVLFECHVLEYRYLPASRTFTWVGIAGMFFETPDAFETPRGHTLFVRLHFTGVANFLHQYPTAPNNRFKRAAHHFFAPDYVGTYESENCHVTALSRSYHLRVNLPYLLGVIKFLFTDVEVTLLPATHAPTGDAFALGSPARQRIDMDRPFGPLQEG